MVLKEKQLDFQFKKYICAIMKVKIAYCKLSVGDAAMWFYPRVQLHAHDMVNDEIPQNKPQTKCTPHHC